MFHWLVSAYFALTGANNEPGKTYGFWSGFGGATIIFSGTASFLIVHYRHINCQKPKCPRIGHYPDSRGVKWCGIHHPDHGGTKPTVAVLHRLHREHLDRAAAGQ